MRLGYRIHGGRDKRDRDDFEEPAEDAVDLAALLHDNGFTWDDANAVNAILTHHELVVLRAATPSPTPPEGLRAALVLAHSMLHSGESPTRQSEDIMQNALLASPAPDPGAVPVERIDDELGHQLDAWLAPGSVDPTGHNATPDGEPSGDCYKCRRIRDFIREYVAAPSAEPPETETA